MTTIEKFKKMQRDCYYATTVLRRVSNVLGTAISDEEAEEWIEAGPSMLIDRLFFLAAGRKPFESKASTGVITVEKLEESHFKILEIEYGLKRGIIDVLITDLDKLKSIDYFDMEIENGTVYIHPSELKGDGVTGMAVIEFDKN